MKLKSAILAAAICISTLATPAYAMEKLEGPGFATPEEAATAYMEAFAENDVDAMMDCFAVESYVENYDLPAQVDRVKQWMLFLKVLPGADDNTYAERVSVYNRIGAISETLSYQYCTYAAMDKGVELDNMMLSLNDGTGKELLEDSFGTPFWVKDKIQNIEVITPEEFKYIDLKNYREASQRSEKYHNDVLHVEDSQELVCQFTAGEGTGYQFIRLGKYNGKWYIVDMNGILPSMLAIDVKYGGLLYGTEPIFE